MKPEQRLEEAQQAQRGLALGEHVAARGEQRNRRQRWRRDQPVDLGGDGRDRQPVAEEEEERERRHRDEHRRSEHEREQDHRHRRPGSRGEPVRSEAEREGGRDRRERHEPTRPAPRCRPCEAQRHEPERERHHQLEHPHRHAAEERAALLAVRQHQPDRGVRQDAARRRGDRGRDHAPEAPHPARLGEELRRRERQVAPLARRDETAQEREPEHHLLQVVGARGNVHAERPAQRVDEREERGRGERGDQQPVLERADRASGSPGGGRRERAVQGRVLRGFVRGAAARGPGLRLRAHFAAAPRCLRYSSR